jgi:hypothetical protein
MKYKIIEKLAKEKTIEKIIKNVVKNDDDDTLKDLSQMLYEDLLMKDNDMIVNLYETKKLQYFLTRMVLNSINSKTSRYYYTYTKYNNMMEEIADER